MFVLTKWKLYFYQTKLREGNIFTGVCHSVRECGGGWVAGVGTLHASYDRPHGILTSSGGH